MKGKVISFLRRVLWEDPCQRWFVLLLLFVNAGGAGAGYFWYAGQLAVTRWYLWPLVADSPVAATIFTGAMASLLGRKSSFLLLWGSLSVIKYGLWAVIILLHYLLFSGGQWGGMRLFLLLSHAGMFVEGGVYLRHLRISWEELGGVAGWMLLNDYLDYALGFHPYLFDPRQWYLAFGSALTLTLILIFKGAKYVQSPSEAEDGF